MSKRFNMKTKALVRNFRQRCLLTTLTLIFALVGTNVWAQATGPAPDIQLDPLAPAAPALLAPVSCDPSAIDTTGKVSPPFGAAVYIFTDDYDACGVHFSEGPPGPNTPTAMFSDPPLAWGGVNGGGIVDLISNVDGKIVVPGTGGAAGQTDSLTVEVGNAAVGSLTLEAFDCSGNLIGSTVNDDGTGPNGRTLATLNIPGIASFRVSGADTWGMPSFELETPVACGAVDDDYSTPEDTALNVAAPGVLSNDIAPIVNEDSNGGFETGDSTGWTLSIPAGGDASVVTSQDNAKDCEAASTTYFPVEGSYFLTTKTNGPGSQTTATREFVAYAGQNVSGSAAFDFGDYSPFNDMARVEILDAADAVIATPWSVNGNSVPDYWNGPWTVWNWVAPAAGVYKVRTVVVNDSDGVCDSRAHFDDVALEWVSDITAVLDTTTSFGSLTLNPDGSFEYDPVDNYCGPDSFTYHFVDELGQDSNIATVSIDVTCVNDPPVITLVDPTSQTSDYSDYIGTVTITVQDIDDTSTTLTEANEPPLSATGLSVALTGCVIDNTLSPNPLEDGSVCTFTYDGQVLDPGDNDYAIEFTAHDDEPSNSSVEIHTLTIEPEDATVTQDAGNDVAIQVAEEGGDSGVFQLYFSAVEMMPDLAGIGSPEFGDLNEMVPYMELVPVGPGSAVPGACIFIGPLPDYPAEGYGQVALFECEFDEVPVNTYEVVAWVDGASVTTRYYAGSDDGGVLVVFDPSLGFTTGGGWFYWPGTENPDLLTCGEDGYAGDKTNFGYSMKYNKKKTNVKGSLLLQRHTVDANCEGAGKYRVKSNALGGLSIGEAEDDDGTYGWAVFNGKSNFREPGEEDGEGNHPFIVYVDDHSDQGGDQDPADEFWIRVEDKDGNVVLEVNGPDSDPAGEDGADGDDTPIENGNIIVPH